VVLLVVRIEVFLKGYLKAHGKWVSDKAKNGYIKDNTQSAKRHKTRFHQLNQACHQNNGTES
jgi:hypothetical protein